MRHSKIIFSNCEKILCVIAGNAVVVTSSEGKKKIRITEKVI